MNKNPEKLTGTPRCATRPDSSHKFWRWVTCAVGIVAGVSLLVYQKQGRKAERSAAAESRPTQVGSPRESAAGAAMSAGDEEQARRPRGRPARLSPRPASEPVAAGQGQSGNVGSLAAAQQLIDRLAQLDVSKGLLTPEDSQRLNKIFKELVAQGPAGIPAIRAFLERNEDLNFSDLKGGDLADYRSLRMGLLDALKQVGGPEAMAVSLQTLQHTADPWEVAVLARDLEQQAPGQFRQEALTAVRESLAQAVEGKLGERDVAPLFQVLQSYADASIVADLEKIPPQWSYYAAITLANLSGGEGIPALIRQVQDPTAMSSGQSDIALRCLAQASVEHPQASEALAEMARSSQISDTAWSAIASALAGYNLEIGKPLVNNSSGSIAGPGLEAYHLEDGGQNLFSTPVTASWLDETIDSRLAIIDRLLSANPSPTAAALLQQARASLASKAVALTIVPH